MADFIGLKISKPGVDVEKAELKDLDFHSDYPLLKIAKTEQGIKDVSVTGVEGIASGGVTITHNLNYVPRVIALASIEGGFMNNNIDNYFKIPYSQTSSGGMFGDTVIYTLDSTEMVIEVSGYGWTEGARFGYAVYIFYEDR
jgi:hypothetical protein